MDFINDDQSTFVDLSHQLFLPYWPHFLLIRSINTYPYAYPVIRATKMLLRGTWNKERKHFVAFFREKKLGKGCVYVIC